MKKLMILLAIALTANVMMAQKMDRTNAYNYNRNGQYEKAIASIEKCVNHEGFLGMRPKDQAQAWLYRGMIYLNVHQNKEAFAQHPDALELAYESLERCIKTDPDYASDNASEIYPRIAHIAVTFFQNGVENFNSAHFPEAAVNFRKSYDISLTGANPDTSALSNTALSYKNAKMYEDALTNYQELQALGVNSAELYKNMAACYLEMDNQEKTLELIEAGLEKYPGDPDMIIGKVNLFLKQGKGQEAAADLEKLHELEPNNVSVLFALGDIYDNEDTDIFDSDKALGYYKDALNIDSTYYDAIYNIVALYVDLSNKKNAEADALLASGFTTKKAAQADALVLEGNDFLQEALPYAERAFNLQPSSEVGQVLRSIYTRLKMTDKAAELKQRLEEL